MGKSAAVNDQDESTGAFTVVVADERGDTSIDALKGDAIRLFLLRLVQTNTVLLQNATVGEEILNGVEHLHVNWRSAVASAANDDDVVVAADEVRTVTDGNGSLELVPGEDPDLDIGFLEVGDGLGDAILQTVLDGSCA